MRVTCIFCHSLGPVVPRPNFDSQAVEQGEGRRMQLFSVQLWRCYLASGRELLLLKTSVRSAAKEALYKEHVNQCRLLTDNVVELT